MEQIYICGAFSHAPNKQSRANSSTLVQPLLPFSSLQCWKRVHAISPEFQHCIGGWGEGKATHFETDNSAFLKNSVLKTQKINAITQVSQGILSTIVAYEATLYRFKLHLTNV